MPAVGQVPTGTDYRLREHLFVTPITSDRVDTDYPTWCCAVATSHTRSSNRLPRDVGPNVGEECSRSAKLVRVHAPARQEASANRPNAWT